MRCVYEASEVNHESRKRRRTNAESLLTLEFIVLPDDLPQDI